MKPKKRRDLFRPLWSAAVAAAAALVLLDTFVIPRRLTVTAAAAATTAAAASTAVATTADTAAGTDTAEITAAAVTDSSYDDGNISISITTTTVADTQVYIADITLSDISYLQTALAHGTYGRNIKETTSAMAQENNAILAINGDYYGFRNSGYVLRNGVLYRDTSSGSEDLAILSDGSFYIFDEDEVTAEQVQAKGALQIFSFGPALITDGAISVSENEEVGQATASNPRTAIGCISPLHYIIIVSDGRTSESAGLSLYELASLFAQYGCTDAYNLDGGGSSTLWFNGSVINNPVGGSAGNGSSERKVSDIVYIG